jgi:hypothetical protein
LHELRESSYNTAALVRTQICFSRLRAESGALVDSLTTQALARACRVFMTLAYPGGAATIPEKRRWYFEIDEECPLESLLPPSACAAGICQDLSKRSGGLVGYEFRLGSAAYPHLKLRIQLVEFHEQMVWVYSVDTHDGFHKATQFLNDEEAAAWRALVEHNRQLKHRIEEALANAGFVTPVRLLRIDLTTPANPT